MPGNSLAGVALPPALAMLLGFVLSSMALGLLVGGAVYAAAGHRGSRRAWLVGGPAGVTAGLALIAALPSAELVFAGAFLAGLASGLCNGLLGVLVLERMPEEVFGRVMGIQNAAMVVAVVWIADGRSVV